MRNRRGSVYILVLASSLLVAIIGISALTTARIQHRAAAGTDDLAEARLYARSALEIALHNISEDPNWRTTYGNTNWPKNQPIGKGIYTIQAVDPEDGDVTTGNLDPVELTGVGTRGLATQKIRVRLEADPPPLAALNTALHAKTKVHVAKDTVNGAIIEVTGIGGPNDSYALRAKGSTEDIFGEATMHPWAIVPVDANQVLEGKIKDVNLDFFLVGHTLGGDEPFKYIDPSVDVTPAVSGAWTSVDVSAYVPAGATGVIVHVVGANGTGYIVGWSGTILKTTDGGSNWSPQTSGTTSVLKDVHFPVNATTGYAVGNNGTILKTTDGGTNWSAQTSGTTFPLFDVHFPVDATTGYAVGGNGTILKTTDGGATWTPQNSGTWEILDVVHFPVDTSTGYVVGSNGTILKTTDGGEGVVLHPTGNGSVNGFPSSSGCGSTNHWDCVNDQAGNAGTGPAVTNDGTTSYLQDTNGSTNREMFSLDDAVIPAGSTVTSIEVRAWVGNGAGAPKQVKPSYQRIGTDASPVDGLTFTIDAGGCCTQLVSSSWSGLTWSAADIDSLEIGISHTSGGAVNVSQLYAVVNYQEAAAGAGWNPQTSGTIQPLNGVCFPADSSTGYVVGNSGTILKTTDGGTKWNSQTSGTTNNFLSVHFPVGVSIGYAVGSNGTIRKTIDGGSNWNPQTSGTTEHLWEVQALLGATTGYVVGTTGTILKTTDGGINWNPQTSGTTQKLEAVHFPVDPTSGYIWGLRKPGSFDDHRDLIYQQDHLWAMIGVDANRVFEAYIDQTDVTLRLAGYTGSGVTFFTNAIDKSLSTTNTWTEIDISPDTGTDTAIGAIIEIDGALGQAYGVRMKGSTDNRIRDARHTWAVIGLDDFEAFEGNITDPAMDFYLVGYITEGAVFKTNADDISLTTAGSYVDINLSALTGPDVGSVTVVGAPLSSDVEILNEGVIYGDAEAGSTITNPGTITGTQSVPVPNKTMPASTVFNMYVGLATTIPNPGLIDGKVLSPGNNPWGATNPDGVYYIDTLGADLTLRASRIHGTLVVKCGSGTVRLETAALLHPYRSDYPTLIVDGNLELLLDSADKPLSEAQWGVNFNPAGTLYKALSNVDLNDDYPNEVQGLVHVTRNLLMGQSSRVWGAIICEDTATCQQDTAVIHDPSLYDNPPLGYTEAPTTPPMTIVSGSWQQVVD